MNTVDTLADTQKESVFSLSKMNPAFSYVALYYFLRYLRGDTFAQLAEDGGTSTEYARHNLRDWRRFYGRRYFPLPAFESFATDRRRIGEIIAGLAPYWDAVMLPEMPRSAHPDPLSRLIEDIAQWLRLRATLQALTRRPPQPVSRFDALSKTTQYWLRQQHVNSEGELIDFLYRHRGLPYDAELTETIANTLRNFAQPLALHGVDLSPESTRPLTDAAKRARDQRKRNIAPATLFVPRHLHVSERQQLLAQLEQIRRGEHPPYEGVIAMTQHIRSILTSLIAGGECHRILQEHGYRRVSMCRPFPGGRHKDDGLLTFLRELEFHLAPYLDKHTIGQIAQQLDYCDGLSVPGSSFRFLNVSHAKTKEILSEVLCHCSPLYFLTSHAEHVVDLAYEAKFGEPAIGDAEYLARDRLTTADMNAALDRLVYLSPSVKERTGEVLFRWMLSIDSNWP